MQIVYLTCLIVKRIKIFRNRFCRMIYSEQTRKNLLLSPEVCQISNRISGVFDIRTAVFDINCVTI